MDMLKLAQEKQLPVIAEFNGTLIRANPDDTEVMIVERWEKNRRYA